MKRESLFDDAERLAALLKEDKPPAVHVAPRVIFRLRKAENVAERTLALLAAGSCAAAALAVAAFEFTHLLYVSDPFEALFQIVPPIGL